MLKNIWNSAILSLNKILEGLPQQSFYIQQDKGVEHPGVVRQAEAP